MWIILLDDLSNAMAEMQVNDHKLRISEISIPDHSFSI